MIVVTAPAAQPTSASQPPAFLKASGHHYRSAQLATKDELHISADHLAGLAAECAIKAILLDYLGSRLNEKQRPFSPDLMIPQQRPVNGVKPKKQDRKEYSHEHLPELWGQLSTIASRRRGRETGPLFMQLIQQNPFHDWDVGGRYCDDTNISDADLTRHLQAARDLLAAHQQAITLGTGTLA
ncbi:hypothetical protein [Streptomyces sp. NPDC056844]|uniref:hypothetical protein n=1 Tax=unclassified Streptomyces TaxID=2593676 RepID=UPI0036BFF63C